MHSKISIFMVIIILCLYLTMPALAKTEYQIRQKLQLEHEPIDMLVSSNNKWIYILNAEGQIIIYRTSGQLRDTIDIGPDIDQIKSGPRDDMLFLLSRKSKSVQVITIEFTEKITTQGSPFKGPAEAPVTVAVFTDFQ